MPSITALRALLGASLGLGAVDLVVVDVVLAPEVADRGASVVVASPAPPTVPVAAVMPVAAMPAAAMPAAAMPTVAVPEAVPEESAPEEPPPAEPVSRGKRVYFATMSAVLDTRARDTLDLLVAANASFVLEGHADHRGDDSYNEKLSRKRALAVEDYLVERGVERTRIEVRYTGELEAEEDTDLWRDRRVDILISGGSR